MMSKGAGCELSGTVEPDLIVTEMLMFPSKSARNKNDSDLLIVIP